MQYCQRPPRQERAAVLSGLLRQSVFGRLAGYEDVNDANRLARNPAMRWIVGGRALRRLPVASRHPPSGTVHAVPEFIWGMSVRERPDWLTQNSINERKGSGRQSRRSCWSRSRRASSPEHFRLVEGAMPEAETTKSSCACATYRSTPLTACGCMERLIDRGWRPTPS